MVSSNFSHKFFDLKFACSNPFGFICDCIYIDNASRSLDLEMNFMYPIFHGCVIGNPTKNLVTLFCFFASESDVERNMVFVHLKFI
uniref:Uncharacterized protein n=1 Tax=Noccaea caerulescens TaxID=107243 RepID=A0A1J3FVB2_NOCCA